MDANLTQHPCKNKCTNFDGEQCNTCLLQQIEKREFDLGLAPNDAYVIGVDLAADEGDKSVEIQFVFFLINIVLAQMVCRCAWKQHVKHKGVAA